MGRIESGREAMNDYQRKVEMLNQFNEVAKKSLFPQETFDRLNRRLREIAQQEEEEAMMSDDTTRKVHILEQRVEWLERFNNTVKDRIDKVEEKANNPLIYYTPHFINPSADRYQPTQQVEALRREIAWLNKKLDEKEQENEWLKGRQNEIIRSTSQGITDELESEIERLTKKVSDQKAYLEDYRTELKNLNEENTRLARTVQESQKIVQNQESLKRDIEFLRNQNNKLWEARHKLEKENHSLRSTNDIINNLIKERTQKNINQRVRIGMLEEINRGLQSWNEDIATKNIEHRERIRKLEAENRVLSYRLRCGSDYVE